MLLLFTRPSLGIIWLWLAKQTTPARRYPDHDKQTVWSASHFSQHHGKHMIDATVKPTPSSSHPWRLAYTPPPSPQSASSSRTPPACQPSTCTPSSPAGCHVLVLVIQFHAKGYLPEWGRAWQSPWCCVSTPVPRSRQDVAGRSTENKRKVKPKHFLTPKIFYLEETGSKAIISLVL